MTRLPRFFSRPAVVSALAVIGFMAFAASALEAAELIRRHVPPKPAHSELWPGLQSDLLIVKFVEGSQVRLSGGVLASLAGADLSEANTVLAGVPGVDLRRLFTRPVEALDQERTQAQLSSGRELADLNNYYQVRLPSGTPEAAEELLDRLNALPIVEIAYAEPIPETASLDESDLTQVTPNFVPQQGYLTAAPLGVDAFTAWTHAGGRGDAVKVIDVEIGWNWTHEDHKAPFYQAGVQTYDDHGVAVVGEIMGQDNGFGISGISPNVEIGCHSVIEVPTADVFNQVAAALDPGDIYLIELHCPGPNANGGGQFGYIALEWWQANFDAIATASARGVICCEAAGNGEQDFDGPNYLGLFDRNVRDSGAIIVGAAVGSTRQPEWFTNYGSRVDLHGWGSSVVTTGYGDLQGGNANIRYTAGFSGTSSATPIVVGSVASLQGAYKAASGGTPLPPGTIMRVLVETGTPQAGTKHIGPRPNLAAAIPAAVNNLATLVGQVTEVGSGLPIEAAEVRLIETGARAITGSDGTYSLLATAGTWTAKTSHFGHAAASSEVITTAGGATQHDVALVALSTAAITGRVSDEDGAGIPGADVRVVDSPLDPAITDSNGNYAINDVPFGFGGEIEATILGRTPDVRSFLQTGFGVPVDLRLALPNDFEADNGGFTVNSGQWQWGTPNFGPGPAAHSGAKCWGTNLTGNYSTTAHRLYTGTFDLTDMESPRLTFWQWYAIWGPYDGANVSISTNNGTTWTVIQPVGGYDDTCIDAFPSTPCAPGYTNSSDGWVPGVFDLTPWEGLSVRFRFWLQPWGYTTTAGWYLDDLAVHGESDITSVEAESEPRFLLARPEPHPVRGETSVQLFLPQRAEVNLRLFDPAGRLVRTLGSGVMESGAHQMAWDGTSARGQVAPPGVYFLRCEARGADGRVLFQESERVVVVR